MADLISRAAAIDYLMTNMGWRDEDGYEVDDADEKRAIITDLLNGVPAVDAVPVVHGLWDIQISKHYADRWQADAFCSRCEFEKNGIWSGFFPDIQTTQAREITRHYALKVKLPKYCENCGAKMDGERRENK